ncbi:hypothetical protein B0T22DRAFT_386563, partial [Podospora appendiculata]
MLLLQTLRSLVPRPTLKQPLPTTNPSIGEFYCMMGLVNRCWQAVGPVRDMFELLSCEISVVLSEWDAPDDEILGWSIFMIGPTEQTARPTLLIYGENASARKTVRTIIEDSGIMQRYPNVRLNDECRSPPDFNRVD